ncbi:MAG: DNA-3-methyladenine glycosylase I [Phycisphaerales bacterium]
MGCNVPPPPPQCQSHPASSPQAGAATTSDSLASTRLSAATGRVANRCGLKFVGTTICYAFMQAVGVVDDHVEACPAGKARRTNH